MKRNFTGKIYDPVFRMTFRLIYGDFRYFKTLMYKFYKIVDNDDNCGGKTMGMGSEGSECVEEIMMYVDNTAPEDYVKSAVMHESVHATYYTLKARDINMDIKEGEVFAYYQEFLVKACNKLIETGSKADAQEVKNGKK